MGKEINHRNTTVKLLEKINPESVLELGCGYGDNLLFIRNSFPNVKLVGTDIDKPRILFAKKACNGKDIEIIEQDILNIDFPDKSFDVVLIDAVLLMIELSTEQIKEIIGKTAKIAKKAIILIEFHHLSAGLPGKEMLHFKTGKKRFVRNYLPVLSTIEIKNIEQIKITSDIWDSPKWQMYGYYLIAKL